MAEYKSMYEKFVALKEQRNISISKLSKEIGLDRTMFSHWKAGKYEPKRDKIQKIADYFGVDIDYFYLDEAISEHNESVDSLDDEVIKLTDKEKKMLTNKLALAIYDNFGDEDFSDYKVNTIIKLIEAVEGVDDGN